MDNVGNEVTNLPILLLDCGRRCRLTLIDALEDLNDLLQDRLNLFTVEVCEVCECLGLQPLLTEEFAALLGDGCTDNDRGHRVGSAVRLCSACLPPEGRGPVVEAGTRGEQEVLSEPNNGRLVLDGMDLLADREGRAVLQLHKDFNCFCVCCILIGGHGDPVPTEVVLLVLREIGELTPILRGEGAFHVESEGREALLPVLKALDFAAVGEDLFADCDAGHGDAAKHRVYKPLLCGALPDEVALVRGNDECLGGEVGDEVLELHGVGVELDGRHSGWGCTVPGTLTPVPGDTRIRFGGKTDPCRTGKRVRVPTADITWTFELSSQFSV